MMSGDIAAGPVRYQTTHFFSYMSLLLIVEGVLLASKGLGGPEKVKVLESVAKTVKHSPGRVTGDKLDYILLPIMTNCLPDDLAHNQAVESLRLVAEMGKADDVVEALVEYGMEHDESIVRKASVTAGLRLLTFGVMDDDQYRIVLEGLISRAGDVNEDVVDAALEMLSQVFHHNSRSFDACVRTLGPMYQELIQHYRQRIYRHPSNNHENASKPRGVVRRPSASPHQSSEPGCGSSSKPPLSFGFMPSRVVQQITDRTLGSKARHEALGSFQRYLQDFNVKSEITFRAHLGPLLQFLLGLVADANLKISLRALGVLSILVEKAAELLDIYVAELVPELVAELADERIAVRHHTQLVFSKLSSHVGFRLVFQNLDRGIWDHSRWYVREALLRILMVGLLVCKKDRGRFSATQLIGIVGPICVKDIHPRVREAALECLSLIQHIYLLDMPEETMTIVQVDLGITMDYTRECEIIARLKRTATGGICAVTPEGSLEYPSGPSENQCRSPQTAITSAASSPRAAASPTTREASITLQVSCKSRPRNISRRCIMKMYHDLQETNTFCCSLYFPWSPTKSASSLA